MHRPPSPPEKYLLHSFDAPWAMAIKWNFVSGVISILSGSALLHLASMAILSGHRMIHDLAPTNCSADFWIAFLHHLRQSTCTFPELPYVQSLSEKMIM